MLAVAEALERSAAYPISVDILNRRAGGDAAGALRAPFVLGEGEMVFDAPAHIVSVQL